MLRWLTSGESHGPALVGILEGLPAGVQVTTADVQDALARRRLGYGRGARMKFEQDEVSILGGGGTAAASIAALKELGSPGADVYVRDVTRAAEARAASAAVGLPIRVLPIGGAAAEVAAADVVISTLPPRAADTLAADLAQVFAGERSPGTGGRRPGVLLDVAYDPWPSRIAAAWQNAGGTVVPGLEMLIYQAVEQVRHFTALGGPVPAEVIDVMCDAVGAPRRVF